MNDTEIGTTEELYKPTSNDPCLPGFEIEMPDVVPPPVGNALKSAAAQFIEPAAKAPPKRFLAYAAASAAVAAVAAIAAVGAYKFLSPRLIVREVVKEVKVDAGLPIELLPDSADPALWSIVANMSGEIEGIRLDFKRGLARAQGLDFKVCLDFCQGADYVYVRIAAGATNWVVAVDPDGKIVRSYRISRKNRKPLKEILSP